MNLVSRTTRTIADGLFDYLQKYYPSSVAAIVIEIYKGQNKRIAIPIHQFDFNAPTWDMVTVRLFDADDHDVSDFLLTPDKLSELMKDGYHGEEMGGN